MKNIMVKQICSGFAAFSSNDVFLYKEEVPGKNDVVTETQSDDLITIHYLEPDETFYEKSRQEKTYLSADYYKTPEFKKLVDSYVEKGWHKNSQDVSDYYKRKEVEYWENRKKERFVIIEEKTAPEKLQGGFSDTLFNNKLLHDYLFSGRHPFGYIGHSVRKPDIDKYIEEKFMKLDTLEKVINNKESLRDLLAVWLISTDGRHFGDSLEEYALEEQKEKVDAHILTIYNLAFIWSRPEHDGTWEGTKRLKLKYANNLL